jgi:hypothetical protein
MDFEYSLSESLLLGSSKRRAIVEATMTSTIKASKIA